MRNAFKGWRDDAMVTRQENRVDRRLISESFMYWVLRQRGKLLERVRDHRFLQEALEIWRERYEGMGEVLDSTSRIIEQSRASKILRSSLHIWREALTFCIEENEVATVTTDLLA
jgi:Sfi1 spindle body protein